MKPEPDALAAPACPLPIEGDRITLAHGAGCGRTAALLERSVFPRFANPLLAEEHDGATLPLADGTRLAFSTDSYVVSPLFFPGGDIGSLAVHGTLNDLAMCGARPLALSCALLLEEGLPLATLERVLDSMAEAARGAGVPIATGDTKVVERGKGDGLFVNTAGVGLVPDGRDPRPARIRPGDVVLVSGAVGAHGVAVLSAREGLGLESDLASDCACLVGLVEALYAAVPDVHCLRDATRGGLGTVLHEWSARARLEIEVDERAVPVAREVEAACELLGLDPWFLACEGRLVACVPEPDAERALAALRAEPLGAAAACVGRVRSGAPRVVVRTAIGARRLLERPAGEPLPRIC
jgi:hydrogenase expression/formation protein HypE